MIAHPVARASRLCCRYFATSTSTAPPILLKIRKDMKTAMQNKDSNRLSVLKSIMTQTLNASKTSNPITTDIQILALLRKNANASRAASKEFKENGRQDLAEKEDCQLRIIEEYAGTVEVIGDEEIKNVVRGVIGTMSKSAGTAIREGDVLKRVFSPEILGGTPVEKKHVTKIVKQMLAEA